MVINQIIFFLNRALENSVTTLCYQNAPRQVQYIHSKPFLIETVRELAVEVQTPAGNFLHLEVDKANIS